MLQSSEWGKNEECKCENDIVGKIILLHSKSVICALVGRVCQLDPRDNGARCQSAQVWRKVQQRRATQVLNQGRYTNLTLNERYFLLLLLLHYYEISVCSTWVMLCASR